MYRHCSLTNRRVVPIHTYIGNTLPCMTFSTLRERRSNMPLFPPISPSFQKSIQTHHSTTHTRPNFLPNTDLPVPLLFWPRDPRRPMIWRWHPHMCRPPRLRWIRKIYARPFLQRLRMCRNRDRCRGAHGVIFSTTAVACTIAIGCAVVFTDLNLLATLALAGDIDLDGLFFLSWAARGFSAGQEDRT